MALKVVAVRDWMTTTCEPPSATLSKEAVEVDAIISTIGFPLVGGPLVQWGASGGSQGILSAKNVPTLSQHRC